MPTRPPIHQPMARSARQEHDLWRGSAASRGYDHRWRGFRRSFLASNPLCADCEATGRVRAATEVHHTVKLRDHPDSRLDPTACRALCHDCHSVRTARGE